MKKVFALLIALFVLTLPVFVLAENLVTIEEYPAETPLVAPVQELPAEPFSWEYLATILGATAATVLIVQLIKLPLDKIGHIPTRYIVYVISLLILELATYFTSGLTVETGILTALNAVIVALAAMGAYEVSVKKLEEYRANRESNG